MPDPEKELNSVVFSKLVFKMHECAVAGKPEGFMPVIETLQSWLRKLLQAELDDFDPGFVYVVLLWIHLGGLDRPSHEELEQA